MLKHVMTTDDLAIALDRAQRAALCLQARMELARTAVARVVEAIREVEAAGMALEQVRGGVGTCADCGATRPLASWPLTPDVRRCACGSLAIREAVGLDGDVDHARPGWDRLDSRGADRCRAVEESGR